MRDGSTEPLRIGTRGSRLALIQAHSVAEQLDVPTKIVTVATAGDRQRRAGDKSRWVDALESALLTSEIDLAVHSAKDVPTELADGCALLASPARGSAYDALVGASSLDDLASGAHVGTHSLRRRAQLLAARDDLVVSDLSGNVDTRLGRLDARDFDALVLAAVGLERLEHAERIGTELKGDLFTPAPGQGTLVLEGRSDDDRVEAVSKEINDQDTWLCLVAERTLVTALGATCHTPAGAHAVLSSADELTLSGFVGLIDGSGWLRDELIGPASNPEALGQLVAERMLAAGAEELLRQAENQAKELQQTNE